MDILSRWSREETPRVALQVSTQGVLQFSSGVDEAYGNDLRPRQRLRRRLGRDAGPASAAADSEAAGRGDPPRRAFHR